VEKAAAEMKKLGQAATSRSVGNLEAKAARNVTGMDFRSAPTACGCSRRLSGLGCLELRATR
jgi:hypothetical protein